MLLFYEIYIHYLLLGHEITFCHHILWSNHIPRRRVSTVLVFKVVSLCENHNLLVSILMPKSFIMNSTILRSVFY